MSLGSSHVFNLKAVGSSLRTLNSRRNAYIHVCMYIYSCPLSITFANPIWISTTNQAHSFARLLACLHSVLGPCRPVLFWLRLHTHTWDGWIIRIRSVVRMKCWTPGYFGRQLSYFNFISALPPPATRFQHLNLINHRDETEFSEEMGANEMHLLPITLSIAVCIFCVSALGFTFP